MREICEICEETGLFTIDFKNTWSPLFEDKKIIVCQACGFGRITPQIDQKQVIDFYTKVYRSKTSPHHVDFSDYIPAPFVFRGRSFSQLLLSLQYLEAKEHYQILDVGAGLGRSYITAQELLGDKFDFHAIEHDQKAINYYKRFLPRIQVCQDFSQFDDSLDLIILSHSLEHFDLDDMAKFFSDMHSALADDGVIMIEVPHADFRNSRYKDIRFKDTPHLSFFSFDSLKKLVEMNGFKICFLDTAGLPIEEAFAKREIPVGGMKSRLKKLLKGSWGYKYVSRFARQYSVNKKMREQAGGRFLRNPNFQYKGDRAVLRCVIRKSPFLIR